MPKSNELVVAGFLGKLKPAAEAGEKGDYRKAIQILRKLLSETEAPAEAWLLLGRSFHALKDYSQALAGFSEYIRQKPDSPEGYLFLGRSYLAAQMPYRAVPYLRKALEKSPGSSNAKALLGIAYLKSKNSGAAVEMLQAAVEDAPANKRIYRAYLNALMVRGIRLCGNEEYDLGFQILTFVLANADEAGMADSPILRLELGRAARETGRMQEALKHFDEALKLSGNDRRIRWSRASVLMSLGRNDEARTDIENIRSHDNNVPNLPWNSELVDLFMIRSFIEAGQWRKAAASCKNWLKSRNTLPLIRVFYAEALRNMQKYQAAANHLKLALKESPAELEYWYASIMVSWEAGDYKYLQRALNKATALGGDQDLIKRFTVLHNARTSKNTKDLIGELQDAIRTLGPEPEIMYCLADAFLKIGLLDEALGWYKKTITLKKNHERAYLGQIAALEALIAEGNIKKDEHKNLDSLYKAYLELWPSNSSIRRDRAIFLLKTLDFEEAAAELERLLAFEPGKYSLRRVLSYAYRKIGRYREAAVYLKALLREKPDDMMLLIEYSHCIDRAGAPAYAMTILQKAMGYFPPNANLSIAGGILCMRQRKLQEAYEYFREAALLSPEDARPEQWMKICQNEIKKRRNTKK